MESAAKIEQLLAKAESEEREYSWLAASNTYSLALDYRPTSSASGQTWEKRGYALFKAAMQAETPRNFKVLMRQAVRSYQRAIAIHRVSPESSAKGLGLRCQAMMNYVRFWIVAKRSKKETLRNAWKLTRDSLKVLERTSDGIEYGRTFMELSPVVELANALETRPRTREANLGDAVKFGRQAIKLLSPYDAPSYLSESYARTGVLLSQQARLENEWSDEFENLRNEAREFWRKAWELSPNHAVLQLSNTLNLVAIVVWTHGSKHGMSYYKRALTEASNTKDNLLIGCTLDHLANLTNWRADDRLDPQSISDQLDKSFAYLTESRKRLLPLSFTSPREGTMWGGAPEAEYNWLKALCESDVTEKRRLLETAEEATPELMRRAISSQYPSAIRYAHHVCSKVFASLAKLQPETREKTGLLQKALRHRLKEQECRVARSSSVFGEGINLAYLADLKLELSKLAKGSARTRLLEEAIRVYEKSIQISIRVANFHETEGDTSYFWPLAHRQMEFAKPLEQLSEVTGDKSHFERSAKEFAAAAQSFSKTGTLAWAAECYWRAGRANDRFGSSSAAVDDFAEASHYYTTAAEKTPRLKGIYSELSNYMQAWCDIERAKADHSREEFQSAQRHYEKAAELHQAMEKWSSLGPNYAAWAEVEHGEGLSRGEQGEEAAKSFQRARELFRESKILLQKEVRKYSDSEEQKLVKRLIQVSDLRVEYCRARIMIEEARRSSSEGNHQLSAERYGLAAEVLGGIPAALNSDVDRGEIDFIKTITEAWQMMERAEAETAPHLFTRASRLFGKAGRGAPTQKSRMLVLGHSRFSKALHAATTFTGTGDQRLYATFLLHLRQASDYYLKAGFINAAEYAKATKLLVDAYVHMSDADREQDHDKKAANFALAEKVLGAAADSYSTAVQPEKRDQVLRLLKNVREDRDLAVSLAQLLRAPPVVSTTATLAVPQPTEEEPVGLSRFEHADVRAELTVGQRDLRVGDSLSIDIQLVNTGRGLAQLVKVDDAVPTGFEMVERPGTYSVSGHALDMGGRRLGSLQTEELKFKLKPTAAGVTPVGPKILYVDESGEYRSCKLAPVEIVVKEPYVPDWMKGPGAIQIPSEFRFETERAKQVFEHLVKAFRDDYLSKGLFAEKAGWRTLVFLMRESRLPTSAFYGSRNQKGPVLTELERLGLAELRRFPGERGRGGTIMKARLAYGHVILAHSH